jgi:mono/diheme cytochrome c family protein
MSRYSHVAIVGLFLVSCQKETISFRRSDSVEATNAARTASVTSQDERNDEAKPVAPCAAKNKPGIFAAVGESGGNTLALMRMHQEMGNKTLAIAADEDENALHVVDVDSQKPLGMTKLSGKPSRVLATGDGRIVVSLGDVGALEVLEPAPDLGFPLTRRCLIEMPADPMGLALSRDQKTLLVASRWEPTLSVFDAADMRLRDSLGLPRDPTSVMASADGKRAFVTHAAAGILSVVNLENSLARTVPLTTTQLLRRSMGMPMPQKSTVPRKKFRPAMAKHNRIGSQAFVLARSEKGILAPLVMVEPEPPRGTSSGYGSASVESPAVVTEIAAIDESSGDVQIKQAAVNIGPKDCFLPRAAIVDEAHDEIWVSCLGIDAVVVYDASKKHPHDYEKRRIPVPAGPTGLAIDAEGQRAVIFSSFAGEMTFVTHDAPAVVTKSPTTRTSKRAKKPKNEKTVTGIVRLHLPGRKGLSETLALGRALFHAAGKRNVAADGRACASCHPDGRDDGLTWTTQEGPRQTPMLLGRLTQDSAPFGWLGDKKTLPSHFKRTIERLDGMGLKDSERDAIFAYVNSLSPPKIHKTADELRVVRGKAIFDSTETGCSSCHLGEATTDGDRHDVASVGDFEAEGKFETPSLRFIARSAPYFHDGRYGTLLDMVKGCDGKMGATKHLTDTDKASLVAYLETL